jgi:hypothetical protein
MAKEEENPWMGGKGLQKLYSLSAPAFCKVNESDKSENNKFLFDDSLSKILVAGIRVIA